MNVHEQFMNVHNAFLIISVDRESLRITLWIANMLTSNCEIDREDTYSTFANVDHELSRFSSRTAHELC